jgi:hypothetical protein
MGPAMVALVARIGLIFTLQQSLGRGISKLNPFGGVCHGTSLEVRGLGTRQY